MDFERKHKIVVKSVIAGTVILVIIFVGYLILINNSKFKVKSAFRYMFDEVNTAFKTAEKSPIAKVYGENKVNIINKLTANVSFNNDVLNLLGPNGKSIEDLINKSTMEININADIFNKYMDMSTNYFYDNEKIAINTYMDNNDAYIYAKDFYDKYLKTSQNDLETKDVFAATKTEVKIEDIAYIMNIFKTSVMSTLDYGKYNKSKEIINVDGNEMYADKVTLTIDTEFIYKFESIFIDSTIYDEKAKGILFKLVESDKYPDVAALETDMRKDLVTAQSTIYNNEVLGEYSLYSSGIFSNVIRNEVKYFSDEDIVMQYTTYDAIKFDTQISLFKNNALDSEINIKENSKDNYNIDMVFGQDININLQGCIKKSLFDIKYMVKIYGEEDIKGNIKYEIKKSNRNELNHTIAFDLDMQETVGTVHLFMDSSLKIVDDIAKPDFSNSVDIEKITQNDYNNMRLKAQYICPKFIAAIYDILGMNPSSYRL